MNDYINDIQEAYEIYTSNEPMEYKLISIYTRYDELLRKLAGVDNTENLYEVTTNEDNK